MKEIRDVIKAVVPKQNRIEWGDPVSEYKMTFDSQSNQLEPIYFWILDFINDMGWKTEKLVDNFRASPGSGQFGEMGQRESLMQKQGMEMLGSLNTVIKSVLNLIYDLKEFEIRLESYDDYKSESKDKRYRGMLALKQIWVDTVDIKKQNGSINVLTSQAGFVTLRDLFFMINNPKELKKVSNEKDGIVNDQTGRILTPRLDEFWKWVKYSEKELRKRFSIERSYLKSQVETIKMYSAWMKPYLEAAEQLRQKGFEEDAALVNAFSTSMFELTLLATKETSDLPDKYRKESEKFDNVKLKRKYVSIMVITLKYRGHVSQRVTQGGDYGFARGGKVDMKFSSYALNAQELKIVREKYKSEDVGDSMQFSTDVAFEALEDLKEDLKHFLNDKWKEEDEDEKKKKLIEEDINPFTSLWDLFRDIFRFKSEKDKKKEMENVTDIKDVMKDNYIERNIRAAVADNAAGGLYSVYDIYKKAHGNASAPGEGFVNADDRMTNERDVKFEDVFHGQEGHPDELKNKLFAKK